MVEEHKSQVHGQATITMLDRNPDVSRRAKEIGIYEIKLLDGITEQITKVRNCIKGEDTFLSRSF